MLNIIPAVIASNDSKCLSKIRLENELLFTAKQGLRKYKVKYFDVRRARRHTFLYMPVT